MKRVLLFLLLFALLGAQEAETLLIDLIMEGKQIEDPLILELMDSPALKRLKGIDQSGIIRYTVPLPQFSRYSHSIGVYALLHRFDAPRDEQVAGLLHDASHTVFSHVGDVLFNHPDGESSYQDTIHDWALEHLGVGPILAKYGYSIADVTPKNPAFKRLEQPLPDMCADRIEYVLHTSLLLDLLTPNEVKEILNSLEFTNGNWSFRSAEPARKLANASCILTQQLFAPPWNLASYQWTAMAMRRAIELNLFTEEQVHFSTDAVIYGLLTKSEDEQIVHYLEMARAPHNYLTLTDGESDVHLYPKFRGIDPLVNHRRLSEIDPFFALTFEHVSAVCACGWPVKWASR